MKKEADDLFAHLMGVLRYEQSEMNMYGKKVKLPRLQAWFADENMVCKCEYKLVSVFV